LWRSSASLPRGPRPDGAVNEQYLVRALPTSYFVDRSGIIRVKYLGALTPALLNEFLALID